MMSHCRQFGLIVTPDGFPLAYEVMDGKQAMFTFLGERWKELFAAHSIFV